MDTLQNMMASFRRKLSNIRGNFELRFTMNPNLRGVQVELPKDPDAVISLLILIMRARPEIYALFKGSVVGIEHYVATGEISNKKLAELIAKCELHRLETQSNKGFSVINFEQDIHDSFDSKTKIKVDCYPLSSAN